MRYFDVFIDIIGTVKYKDLYPQINYMVDWEIGITPRFFTQVWVIGNYIYSWIFSGVINI